MSINFFKTSLILEKFDFDPKFAEKNPSLIERMSMHHLFYSIFGLVLGLSCVLSGVFLFINGIAGASNWIVKILRVESNLSDAAPGVILFVVGLLIVLITRYSVSIKK